MRRFTIALFAALVAANAQSTIAQTTAARAPSGVSATATYPGAAWERVSPEAAGYSSVGLDSARKLLSNMATTAAMVVVGGRMLFEYGDLAKLSYIASARKSVLDMLYGKYVANGTIKLDATLAELGIDDIGGLSAQEKEATVADLLAARSGVYHIAANAGDNLDAAPPRNSQRHGTYYLYSNWDFNALGTILEQRTHRNIYDALDSNLARPIGMQDFRRDLQRKAGDSTRSKHPEYQIVLSTRDMARLGYLMLRGGRWRGQQVVPPDWVAKSTRLVTPVAEMNPEPLRHEHMGYGYLWWVWDHRDTTGVFDGAYSARGAYGQYITVIPKLDMVVAHKVAIPPERLVAMPAYDQFLDAIIAARRPGAGR